MTADEVTAKMGFGSDRQRVVRTYGHAHEITVDGKTFRVKSDAEAIFFREIELLIEAGAIKEWWYEPESFLLTYRYDRHLCHNTYIPDAKIVWVNPDIGEEYYEIKWGILEAKYANKIMRFCRQYPTKKLVLVWIGKVPQKGKVARRIDKLRPWLDHIWELKK
jgi:hypothetical protein